MDAGAIRLAGVGRTRKMFDAQDSERRPEWETSGIKVAS